MRVRPVASSGTTRIAKRKLQLGPYAIPAGSMLLVPFDAVHHFKGNWEQPDDFIPVRPCPLLAVSHYEQCAELVYCKPQPCSRISSRGTIVLQHGMGRSYPLAEALLDNIAPEGPIGDDLRHFIFPIYFTTSSTCQLMATIKMMAGVRPTTSLCVAGQVG